jgi:hypothetical protein
VYLNIASEAHGDMEDSTRRTNHKFLNVQEAAELLCLAPKRLCGLVSQRRVPFRKAGRRLIFLGADLLETHPQTKRNRNS